MNTTNTPKQSNQGSAERMNPWLSIFSKPTATLDYVWRKYPEDFVHRIFIVSGFVAALGIRMPDWLNLQPHPIGVMIQMLLFAPIVGVVAMYVFAAIMRLFGRLLGQRVDSNRSKVMAAWTNLPFIVTWVIFIISYFTIELTGTAPKVEGMWLGQTLTGWLPIILASPFWIWSIFVRIQGIAWLFGFSKVKSLTTWVLTTLFSYVPAILITYVYFIIFFVTSSSTTSS